MNRRAFNKIAALSLAAPVYLPLLQGGGSTVTDGASLVAAMAQASAGDTITLRGGIYQWNTTWNSVPLRQSAFRIAKPLTLAAYPGEQPILTYDPTNPPLMDGTDYGAIVYASANCTLKNICVVGTHALGDSPGGQDTDVNVMVQNGVTCILDGCTIRDFGHCGAKAYTGVIRAQNTLISGGGFTGRDHGIYISQPAYAGRSIISGCELTGCAGYGVHIYGSPKNVDLIGCTVHFCGGNYTPVISGGGVLIGGPGCLVQDCTITDNTGYGGLVVWKTSGSAYIGNTILRNTPSAPGWGGNITLDAPTGPNVVYNNTRHAAIWPAANSAAWQDDGTDVIV